MDMPTNEQPTPSPSSPRCSLCRARARVRLIAVEDKVDNEGDGRVSVASLVSRPLVHASSQVLGIFLPSSSGVEPCMQL